jgi:hypothetical protein
MFEGLPLQKPEENHTFELGTSGIAVGALFLIIQEAFLNKVLPHT